MVSGALGKISRLCAPIFVMQIRIIVTLLLPSFVTPSLGAMGSCPSRLSLDAPLRENDTYLGHGG